MPTGSNNLFGSDETESGSSGSPSGRPASGSGPAPRGARLVSKKRYTEPSSSVQDAGVPEVPSAPRGPSRVDNAAYGIVTSQEAAENRKHVFLSLSIATFLSLVTYGIKWPKM
jgi:hypothetical protein